ncbi:MAG: DNA repair protein RecO [Pseudomonadota bacterium]
MPGFSTDAVLLRKIEYGDHDYIISFLTQTHGKTSVIAKNAKKSIKRFSGALDLFSVYHIQCVYPKKNKEGLTILSQADLENGFVNIRYDIFKTAYASFWAELIHFWLEEEKPSPRLYDLFIFSLEALSQGIISKEVISLLFQIRFMDLSGFSPNFETCHHCGIRIDDIQTQTMGFDFKEGCLVCQKCNKKKSRYGMTISKGTLKQLFWIKISDITRADRIKFSNYAIKEGEALLEAFIPFHIGREFKSLKFLRQIRQENEF